MKIKEVSILRFFISSIVICLGIIFGNILNVEARIPYTYLNIGGLTPDQQIDSCFYVYGRPTANLAVRNCNGFNINEVTYNSELMVYYINGGYNENGRIRAIICNEDNITTNLGIRVGMNKNDVLYAYGDPDRNYRETQGTTWCYLADSEDHPNMPLYFFFDNRDVIKTIVVGDIGYYY